MTYNTSFFKLLHKRYKIQNAFAVIAHINEQLKSKRNVLFTHEINLGKDRVEKQGIKRKKKLETIFQQGGKSLE